MSLEGAPVRSLDEVRAELAADVRRVADRLRSLSQSRLTGPAPPYPSRAEGARRVAQTFATAAQGVEARRDGGPPEWRRLPVLSDFAVGDQVAVTGHDLLAALAEVGGPDQVWAPGGRRPALDLAEEAARTLADFRRLL